MWHCGVPCLGLIENHLTIFSDFSILAAPDNRTPPLTATSYICGCSNFEWGAGQTIIAGQPPLKGYFQPARLAPESSSTAKQLLVCSFLTFTPNCMYMTCLQTSVQQACFLCTVLQKSGKQRFRWVMSWWACLLICMRWWPNSWCGGVWCC